MWASAVAIGAAPAPPLLVQDVRDYLRIDDDAFNAQISGWIGGARARVERMTGTRLITQSVRLQADSFDDLAQLPIGPVASITSIAYQDQQGQAQLLDPAVYERFGAGLQQGVRPVFNAAWPLARAVAGAITVVAVVGYGVDGTFLPETVRIALLELVRGLEADTDVDVTDWLVNDRLWL